MFWIFWTDYGVFCLLSELLTNDVVFLGSLSLCLPLCLSVCLSLPTSLSLTFPYAHTRKWKTHFADMKTHRWTKLRHCCCLRDSTDEKRSFKNRFLLSLSPWTSIDNPFHLIVYLGLCTAQQMSDSKHTLFYKGRLLFVMTFSSYA